MDDVAATRFGEESGDVLAAADARRDLAVEVVAVDYAQHGAVVVDDERFLPLFGEGLDGGDEGLVREHRGYLLDLDGVGHPRGTAEQHLDELDVLHDLVAGVGDDRFAHVRRSVDDGVAELAVVDQLALVPSDGDVQVGAALHQVGEVLRGFGVVERLQSAFDVVVAPQEPHRVFV